MGFTLHAQRPSRPAFYYAFPLKHCVAFGGLKMAMRCLKYIRMPIGRAHDSRVARDSSTRKKEKWKMHRPRSMLPHSGVLSTRGSHFFPHMSRAEVSGPPEANLTGMRLGVFNAVNASHRYICVQRNPPHFRGLNHLQAYSSHSTCVK